MTSSRRFEDSTRDRVAEPRLEPAGRLGVAARPGREPERPGPDARRPERHHPGAAAARDGLGSISDQRDRGRRRRRARRRDRDDHRTRWAPSTPATSSGSRSPRPRSPACSTAKASTSQDLPAGNFMPENSGHRVPGPDRDRDPRSRGSAAGMRRRRAAGPGAGRRPPLGDTTLDPEATTTVPDDANEVAVEVQNQGESEANSIGVTVTIEGPASRPPSRASAPARPRPPSWPLEPAAAAGLRGDDRRPGRARGGRGRQQQQRVLVHRHLRDAVVARRLPRSPREPSPRTPFATRRPARQAGADPAPVGLRRDPGGRRRRGRPRLRPLRELDRGRGARDARHPRLRRRGGRARRRARLSDQPLPDRPRRGAAGSDRGRPLPSAGDRAVRPLHPRAAPGRRGARRLQHRRGRAAGERAAGALGRARRGLCRASATAAAVLREGVEDQPDNVTRFVWIAPARHRARAARGPGGPR